MNQLFCINLTISIFTHITLTCSEINEYLPVIYDIVSLVYSSCSPWLIFSVLIQIDVNFTVYSCL